VSGGTVKVGVADAQATVGASDVGSPVAAGTAECLTEDRDEVCPVPGTDAIREEPAERGVSEQAPEEALDGSDKSGPPADRLIDADRLRFGGGG
jgi:hypothetical protein